MSVIHLPLERRQGGPSDRSPMRTRAVVVSARRLQVLSGDNAEAGTYCAGCAGPIEFGPVYRGLYAYCSVECSLGDRPA
jgi:hypothetical protein